MTLSGSWPEIAEQSAHLTRCVAAAVSAVTADPGSGGARLLGSTGEEVRATFEQLQAETQRSVWALAPQPGDPRTLHTEADECSRRRGLDLRTIVDEGAVQRPIAAPEVLLRRQIRVAPVLLQMLLVDEDRIVVDGPRMTTGSRSGWLVWDPATVEAARSLWRSTEAASAQLPPSAVFLSERQRRIAQGLVDGLTDGAMARALGVSLRTVASEVRTLMEAVEARSRYQAGMRLVSP
ncbi:helix-turn-helix transcriptional regulator [Oryzihumus leptocrescens]|uniref:Regulatory LuxR family protein n=1 Tax=Oryzihumus leptocrescens TaxID=297536 RepID=A0A542ZGX6_9MICO|nr:helix-turn-helix transcriptional regulator [Oryzihumus leptocrescens]TQL59632.1 regulatory LuxR family protein [Oryzihumus leptocrescens]